MQDEQLKTIIEILLRIEAHLEKVTSEGFIADTLLSDKLESIIDKLIDVNSNLDRLS